MASSGELGSEESSFNYLQGSVFGSWTKRWDHQFQTLVVEVGSVVADTCAGGRSGNLGGINLGLFIDILQASGVFHFTAESDSLAARKGERKRGRE